ncbi:unnamed protein product [Ranitomeya imitator]|uniref:FAD/NAD(P)-binding domain-containing protein n=1 Tax=Ranitomeya imitator TaxID=111125 RepID=A0ABN9MEA0_9NEOB|nr:unnamed protein product [Ranitomeya imitator]
MEGETRHHQSQHRVNYYTPPRDSGANERPRNNITAETGCLGNQRWYVSQSDNRASQSPPTDDLYPEIWASAAEKGKIVVVGGGIAGVTCAEQLAILVRLACWKLWNAEEAPPCRLASFSGCAEEPRFHGALEEFDVEEQSSGALQAQYPPNIRVLHTAVKGLKADEQTLITQDGACYSYEQLCVCTGARPRLITEGNPYVSGDP